MARRSDRFRSALSLAPFVALLPIILGAAISSGSAPKAGPVRAGTAVAAASSFRAAPTLTVAPSTTIPPTTTTAPATTAPPPTTTRPAPTRPAAPAAAPIQPAPPSTSASPPATSGSAYGCAAALSYLATHAALGFTFECPGNALGRQAMTCSNVPGVCPGARIIAIADPCPAAYMNEAYNSKVAEGLAPGPFDPYGYCH